MMSVTALKQMRSQKKSRAPWVNKWQTLEGKQNKIRKISVNTGNKVEKVCLPQTKQSWWQYYKSTSYKLYSSRYEMLNRGSGLFFYIWICFLCFLWFHFPPTSLKTRRWGECECVNISLQWSVYVYLWQDSGSPIWSLSAVGCCQKQLVPQTADKWKHII